MGRESKTKQPETRKEDLVEIIHGTEIKDPYRWLEEWENSEEVSEWIDGQNAYTKARLDRIHGRPQLRERLNELLETDYIGAPSVKEDRLFYYKRPAGVKQNFLCMKEWPDGEEKVVLDPNDLSEDGSIAIAGTSISKDGKLLAYGLCEDGNDWARWRILDIDSGEHLKDEFERIIYTTPSWLPDNSGFFYERSEQADPDELQKVNQRVYFHKLGTDWRDDEIVFGEGLEGQDSPSASVSKDGKHVFFYIFRGWGQYELHLMDRETEEIVHLTEETGPVNFNDVSIKDDKLYLLTNHEAPKFRLCVASLDNPTAEHWEDVIPEGEGVIENIKILGDKLFVQDKVNVADRVREFTLEGELVREITLPSLGCTGGPWGNEKNGAVFMNFTSFFYPPVTFHYDLETGKMEEYLRKEVPFEPSQFMAEQVWFESKDGTEVPMFIIRREDVQLDHTNPTILYGYGGFNIALEPSFAASRISWLEQGGIFAIANLRGGSEFGEDWHRGGMLKNKQNVFDDYIAAAETLIENGYTSSENLAIQGGSNGGLLVAAVAVQRPELFKAVDCGVPLCDMIRYHEMGESAQYWIPEYGSSEEPEQFEYLFEYSPYHNVEEGVEYPVFYIETGEDGRVHPGHALKFAAMLQDKAANPEDILFTLKRGTGHGHSKPMDMVIGELVDKYAFFAKHLGLDLETD